MTNAKMEIYSQFYHLLNAIEQNFNLLSNYFKCLWFVALLTI